MKMIDLTGQCFDRWVVLGRAENTAQRQAQWLCRCECGNERVLKSIVLRKRLSRSCGCLKLEILAKRSTKHGHSPAAKVSPTYNSWAGMVARCTNPRHTHYAYYGGRGITVCDRWLVFADFLADMGEKPNGLSIDRIDNSKGYEPGNCRWATATRQMRNKRNNRILVFNGEPRSVAEWGEILGIPPAMIRDRMATGWTVEKALSTPSGTQHDNVHCRKLTLNGETHTVAEWARIQGVNAQMIHQRLFRGATDEEALRMPG
jgi:hypothetical protein